MIFFKKAIHYTNIKKNNNYEILIIGKSNVGKSSLLNIISNKFNISKKSKFTGRTKLINIFQIKTNIFIIDFPGYGYNILSKKNNINLKQLLIKYLICKKKILGIILLINIKYNLILFDHDIIQLAINYQIPIHILCSKIDKLNYRIMKINIKYNIYYISGYEFLISCQLFSLFNNYTIQNFIYILNTWINKK